MTIEGLSNTLATLGPYCLVAFAMKTSDGLQLLYVPVRSISNISLSVLEYRELAILLFMLPYRSTLRSAVGCKPREAVLYPDSVAGADPRVGPY